MFKLTSDKAAKLPVVDLMRAAILEHVIPILIQGRADMYQGKGQNQTIGQDSFFTTDDETGEKLGFSFSANLWPKSDGKSKSKGEPAEAGYKLSNADVAALTVAIAKAQENADVPMAVKLATIKSVHELNGRVSRDDMKVIFQLA